MKFEWDKAKDRLNVEKHGLSFQMAYLVFEFCHITKIDNRRIYGEERFITMGTLGFYGRIVVIANTRRKDKIRIISMRRANLREQKIFLNTVVAKDEKEKR